jgi:protein-S-isoprenylcysteine O-methyltransferase Ste14
MKKPLPPAYLLIAIALMFALDILLPLRRVVFGLWRLIGLAPLALGVVLNMLADRALKLSDTTVKPFRESSTLVTDGVFRLSRHPMYLGMVLMLIGIAILLGSLMPWTIILAFVVLLEEIFIRIEESMLEETFGNSYRLYKRKSRRWI